MKASTTLLLLLCVISSACDGKTATASGAASATPASSDSSCNPALAPGLCAQNPVSTAIVKIVFVGKEQACDCTRKTVDAGWAALQKALGTSAKVPIEQLLIDTQGEKVAVYRKQRPMMALPAIYFLDGKGAVVELLQGEVSEAQITAILKR